MKTTKIFQSGNSQAIRLPKEYRLDADTVNINKIGNLLVLLPQDDPWTNFVEGIHEAVDFPDVDDLNLTEIKM